MKKCKKNMEYMQLNYNSRSILFVNKFPFHASYSTFAASHEPLDKFSIPEKYYSIYFVLEHFLLCLPVSFVGLIVSKKKGVEFQFCDTLELVILILLLAK